MAESANPLFVNVRTNQWMTINDGISTSSFTSTPFDTDALLTATSTTGGFFSDYNCKGASKLVLVQSEDQTAISGGGFRDALFIDHVDRDVEDYTSVGQKVSMGIRSYVTGYNDGSGYQAQTKDFIGGEFAAIAQCSWAVRGVSGITANAHQYGAGVATNEFRCFNPLSATAQSAGIQAILAIVSGKKAAADSTHVVRGVYADNIGKLATHAFGAGSHGTDGDNGQWNYLLDGTDATIAIAAIKMPASAGTIEGTIINYDSGDETFYDRSGNTYAWRIGGNSQFRVGTGFVDCSTNDRTALGQATIGFSDLYLATGGTVRVNNVQVLTSQQASIADAVAGTEIATINAILARLRTHGIIAT